MREDDKASFYRIPKALSVANGALLSTESVKLFEKGRLGTVLAFSLSATLNSTARDLGYLQNTHRMGI